MTELEDTYRHKGMRKRLLDELRQKGIHNEQVLQAMYLVPRHFFMDKAFEELAYEDKAFPIDEKQTISQPYTVAYQTQLLDVQPTDKVLEIGTGSGYQAAVLAHLCTRVYTVERRERLFLSAQKMFERMGINYVRSFFGDGIKGLMEFAPFNKILVTAGATEIPQQLLAQLEIGGALVIPVGDDGQQDMLHITRLSEKDYHTERFDVFRFVPLLHGKKYLS